MLSTCNKYQKTYYCKHCALKDDCFWMTSIPPEDADKRLACESWECEHYDDCRALRPEQRRIGEI